MTSNQILFSTDWISVKETPKGYQYLERRGKDSIAVFLWRQRNGDARKYEVLIRQQPLCVEGSDTTLYPCPITGGLDGDESPHAAAMREVYEESGFKVNIQPLGKYIVGTQTNEVCFLYHADVTGLEPDKPQQDGTYFESISQNEWHPVEYLKRCEYVGCQIGYYLLLETVLTLGNQR